MRFTYATDLFDESTIALFAARFGRVLEELVTDPGVVIRTIDIVTEQEARKRALPSRSPRQTYPNWQPQRRPPILRQLRSPTVIRLSPSVSCRPSSLPCVPPWGLLSPPMLWFLCRSPDLFRASCRHLASTVSPHL